MENLDQYNESGYIQRDGTLIPFSTASCHLKVAYDYLEDKDGPWQDILEDAEIMDMAADEIIFHYIDQTCNVRYGNWKGNIYIEFANLTYSQLGTIRRKIKETGLNKFDYTIQGISLYGRSLRELERDIRLYGLLRKDVSNENKKRKTG